MRPPSCASASCSAASTSAATSRSGPRCGTELQIVSCVPCRRVSGWLSSPPHPASASAQTQSVSANRSRARPNTGRDSRSAPTSKGRRLADRGSPAVAARADGLRCSTMRVGILTAGGDCPGLNAVIRAASRRLLLHGHEPVGLRRGYRGLAEHDHIALDQKGVSGILPLGGTILSTSNYNPFREPEGIEKVREAQTVDPLDAVIAIGGEHTMMITRRLSEELALPVIGVPKTIDNDVVGTDYTFGFDTAVQTVTAALDRLHTTAQSHDRVMVVEVMGRNTGW